MMQQLFKHIMTSTDLNMEYDIRASFIEIYKEKIQDLLTPAKGKLMLRQGKGGL